MGPWAEINDQEVFENALTLAKGEYQEALLHGTENLSGSTLKGKARTYGARYKASREALLQRMTEAGIPWTERKGERGKRILVIGAAQ